MSLVSRRFLNYLLRVSFIQPYHFQQTMGAIPRLQVCSTMCFRIKLMCWKTLLCFFFFGFIEIQREDLNGNLLFPLRRSNSKNNLKQTQYVFFNTRVTHILQKRRLHLVKILYMGLTYFFPHTKYVFPRRFQIMILQHTSCVL